MYLRSVGDAADYVYIDGQGTVERAGRALASLREHGELVLAEDRVTLFVDGRRLTEPGSGWQIFWEAAEESPPPVGWTLHPLVEASDGFMRHELVSPPCNRMAGEIGLAQHGGGLPRDEAEARSYDFQRAVNPFTVRGSKRAWLLYGEADWAEYLAEARFYFGIPKTGYLVDANSLPVGADMLVVQGGADGLQVGFGWVGAERRFCLVERRGDDGPWRVLARHEGLRPPLTSWVRLGVSVRDGCRLEGWLDRQPVLAALLQELQAYPLPPASPPLPGEHLGVLMPFEFRTPAGTLQLVSTTTVFGSPVDVTLQELALETFFPADDASAAALRALAAA